MRLSEFLNLSIRAHNGVSWSPEKRGAAYVAEYSALLDDDIQQLHAAGIDQEVIDRYEAKFKNLYVSWMHRKSNCLSSMITGPSGFPVRRAQKASASEERAYQTFDSWRKRAFHRLTTDRRPKGIDAELEKSRKDLSKCVRLQEYMKDINAICRKKNAAELLEAKGLTPEQIHTLLNPTYSYEKKGFQGWQLTNNGANIRRLLERVEILEAKELERLKQRDGELNEWQTECGATVTLNYELDRVTIRHETKPDPEVIQKLKSNAFNWSPFHKCWMRKITPQAITQTKRAFPAVLLSQEQF
jgi:hypothetical protein